MSRFTTGIIAGTVIGAGLALAVNPMDRRDARRAKNRATRTMRNISRAVMGG